MILQKPGNKYLGFFFGLHYILLIISLCNKWFLFPLRIPCCLCLPAACVFMTKSLVRTIKLFRILIELYKIFSFNSKLYFSGGQYFLEVKNVDCGIRCGFLKPHSTSY